jgi:hypothetical protein
MQHIPLTVRPDTSNIAWSTNMRTHLISTIAHANDPAPVTEMGGPLPETRAPPTPDHTATPAITHVTEKTKSHIKATATPNKQECTPPPPSPPPTAPHTPTPHRRQRKSTPTSDDDDDRARHIRELKVRTARKDTTQRIPRRTRTHHIVARDCVLGLHWEVKRNDQCVTCELPRSTPPLSPETAG